VVVAPEDVATTLRAHLSATLPSGTVGHGRAALDSPVVVLTVHEVKGLEFDAVVLVEPAAILKASPRGANDLYVALTRPTQRLRVLASGDLPAGLDASPPRDAARVLSRRRTSPASKPRRRSRPGRGRGRRRDRRTARRHGERARRGLDRRRRLRHGLAVRRGATP
jgi:hypothetical protein